MQINFLNFWKLQNMLNNTQDNLEKYQITVKLELF